MYIAWVLGYAVLLVVLWGSIRLLVRHLRHRAEQTPDPMIRAFHLAWLDLTNTERARMMRLIRRERKGKVNITELAGRDGDTLDKMRGLVEKYGGTEEMYEQWRAQQLNGGSRRTSS